ncbi:M56 family metallopeptidase [bacterium 1xD42-67]|nr:M56 family metallopeptidase [bacterium 1xD42-67]
MRWLIQWAVSSAALILIVLAVRYLFRNRLSARLRYALWGVVLLRLLVPLQIQLPTASDPLPLLASDLARPLEERLDAENERLSLAYTALIPSELVTWEEIPQREDTYLNVPLPYDRAPLPSYMTVDKEDVIYQTIGAGDFNMDRRVMRLWQTGAGLTALVILGSNLRFSLRLRRRRRPLETDCLPPPVYVAEGLPSPCLFGFFPPAVYLTPAAAADPVLEEHALAHERTHYRHGDWFWSLARCACLALHWYDPLVWLAAALSKADGELACDEGTVARLGEERRLDYGRSLVDLAAQRSARPADLLSMSTAMTGGKKSIRQRVTALVKKPETGKTALFALAAVVILAVVFVFAGRTEQRPDLYGPYKYQVGRTQAVRYSPSPLSSQTYPDAITDPDLLEKALDILDHAADLLNTPEELDLDLSDAPFLSPRVTLLEGPDDSGHTYLLYTAHAANRDQCYLVTPAEIGAGPCSVAAVLDTSAPGALELLARQQRHRKLEDLTPATFDYNQYHTHLGMAQGIWLNMPMLHDGRVLTDPEQLEQVKKLLVLEPIPRSGPLEWEWDGDWTHIIAFSTTPPDPDWTGADAADVYYILDTDEGFYYVCFGDMKEGGYYIGTISKENWDRARELLENAPSVDDRQHAYG